jgi:hypothetical protein
VFDELPPVSAKDNDMNGMPELRSVTIVHALDALLTEMERLYEPASTRRLGDTRLETGVPAIDRLLGGIPTGEVTALAVDHPVHADALAASVVCNSRHETLLAASDLLAATRTIVAATAQIPYVLLETGHLGQDDWDKIIDAVRKLRDRPIHLTTMPSAVGIVRAAKDKEARMCVVLAPERLATRLDAALHSLANEVHNESIAVLALTSASTDDADAVVLAPSPLSNTLELITSDPADLLRHTTITINRQARYAI